MKKIKHILYFVLCAILIITIVKAIEDYDSDAGPGSLSSIGVRDNFGLIEENGQLYRLRADQLQGNLEMVNDLSDLNQQELTTALRNQYPGIGGINLAGQSASIEGNILTIGTNTIDLGTFQTGAHTIEVQNGGLYIDGDQVIGAENVREEGEAIVMDSVESFSSDGTTITNGVNVRVYGDRITADHADSFIQGSSITTNIDNLDSSIEQFSVGRADSLLSNGVTVSNIVDTTFTVDGGRIEMQPANGVSLSIEDSNYAETTFTAIGDNSRLVIEDNNYSVTNGSITSKGAGYNETIEANNTAVVTVDPNFGFECMEIEPVGTYYYNDINIIKDFAVHIPANSSSYRLCIRKDISQSYSDYNGLIDFVGKKIRLDGIVNFL